MTQEQFTKRIGELLADSEFSQALNEAKDTEEAAVLFRTQGIDITAEALEEAIRAAQDTGELKEEQLDDVSGGILSINFNPNPGPFSRIPRLPWQILAERLWWITHKRW